LQTLFTEFDRTNDQNLKISHNLPPDSRPTCVKVKLFWGYALDNTSALGYCENTDCTAVHLLISWNYLRDNRRAVEAVD